MPVEIAGREVLAQNVNPLGMRKAVKLLLILVWFPKNIYVSLEITNRYL